jgi:hypothetical protein
MPCCCLPWSCSERLEGLVNNWLLQKDSQRMAGRMCSNYYRKSTPSALKSLIEASLLTLP